MHLLQLDLHNYCQYRDFTVEFNPYLNAIVGPIGSGKSNLLNAIIFAFTGELPGVKKDSIYQQCAADELSYVQLTFRHQDVTGILERSLQPLGQSLTLGQQVFTKDAEIKFQLERLLTKPISLICKYAVVRQLEIFHFLMKPASQQTKDWETLFELDKASHIHNLLHKVVLSESSLITSSDTLRLEIDELTLRLQSLQSKYTCLHQQVSDDWCEWDDPDYLALTTIQKLETKQQILVFVNKRLLELQQQNQQLQQRKSKLQQKLEPLQPETAYPRQQALQNKVKDLQTIRNVLTKVDELCSQSNELPDEQTINNELTKLHQQTGQYKYEEVMVNTSRLQTFLTTFDPTTGVGECPTCGTPTDSLQDRYLEFKNKLQVADRVFSIYMQIDRLTKEQQKVQLQRTSIQQKINQLLEQLPNQTYQVLSEIEIELTSTQSQLEEMNTQLLMTNDLIEQLTNTDKQEASLQGQLQLLTEQQEQTQQEINTLQQQLPLDFQPQETKLNLQQKKQAFIDKQTLYFTVQQLEGDLARKQTKLQQVIVLEEQNKRNDHFRPQLEQLTRLFHYDQFPRKYIHARLRLLMEPVNQLLSQFGCSFLIKDVKDLTFILSKHGNLVSTYRLSVGEKILFSLAMRIAINLDVIKDIGLLVLDEPTAGLDRNSLSCVEIAFRKLQEMSQKQHFQVVLSTHERSLDHLFDQVVTL